MYKISGKQQFGAVWDNGKCIAIFNRGVAYTNDTEHAELLREKGYTVEGEADPIETMVDENVEDSEEVAQVDENVEDSKAEEPEEVPLMGVNPEKPKKKGK